MADRLRRPKKGARPPIRGRRGAPGKTGSAFARGLRGAGEPFGFILNFRRHLGQHRRMLPVVMSTEQQFAGVGQQDADERLGTAAVTTVRGSERLGGG